MTPLRYAWHLVTRFFGVLASRRLSPGEQDEISTVLTANEAQLFWRQQAIDQRHAWQVADRVRTIVGDDEDAIAAALLHDVGKLHSGLGPISRSVATVLDHLGLPMPQRWLRYRQHEELGAADLRAVGARSLAIAFAAGEQSGDPAVWNALIAADNGTFTRLSEKGETLDSVASRNSMPPEVN